MMILYVIAFSFGIMLGWTCFWLIRRVEKVSSKLASFVFAILSGGAILYFTSSNSTVIWSHVAGLVVGWLLWVFLAWKLGGDVDLFYSKHENNEEGESFTQQKKTASDKNKYF